MIEMRAVRVLDHVEVVVTCKHNQVTEAGHTLAHVTSPLEIGAPHEVLEVIADLFTGLYAAIQAGHSHWWTDDCAW